MARSFMRTVVWIFKTDEANIRMFIFAIVAIILLNNFDVLGLKKTGISENITISVYVIVVFFLYHILSGAVVYLVEQFLIRPKIQIVPIFEGNISAKPSGDYIEYVALLIDIPHDWEIEECYATLTQIKPVYYEDQKLVDYNIQTALSLNDINSRRLLWKSQYQTDSCRLNVGENSRDEFLYVAKIEGGYTKAKNKKEKGIYSESFQLCFCDYKSRTAFLRAGLYSITIRFNYTLDGKKLRPKYFEGYIYSSIGGGSGRGKIKDGRG